MDIPVMRSVITYRGVRDWGGVLFLPPHFFQLRPEDSMMELQATDFWQTQYRGTNDSEYQIYLSCADDGNGIDFTTGKPMKTYDEWLSS